MEKPKTQPAQEIDTSKNNGSPPPEPVVMLPQLQAQEILNFLLECPAGRVLNLIQYIMQAPITNSRET